MAAQEYYQNAAASSPAPVPGSRPAQQINAAPLQVPTIPPYPLFDGPPPPYSPGERLGDRPVEQRPHSQPPPHRRLNGGLGEPAPEKQSHQRPPQAAPSQRPQQSASRPPSYATQDHSRPPPPPAPPSDYESQFRPPVRQQRSYAYPNEKQNGPYQQQYPPQQYQTPMYGSAQPVQSPYTNGYYPNGNTNGNGNGNNVAFAPNPQVRYPSPSRSRSRSRSRDRERGGSKRHHQKKKSSGINTFLGAGGGALIGDAIFPGLGTIGGALLGGFGGHEYGKQKSKDGRHRERRYSDDYEYRQSRR